MKKTLKSLLSVLTVATMLLAFVPGTLVSAAVVEATVTTFGDGVVFTPNGETSTDASLLTDKFYAVPAELADPTTALYRFAQFTETESGIQFAFSEAKTVKRLDLWIYTAGAVKDYEIQISSDGTVYNYYTSGTLEQDLTSDTSCYYPILFDAVETQYLRFVIKSFKDDASGAYIAEAELLDSNLVNLTATRQLPTTGSTAENKLAGSKYARGFAISHPYTTSSAAAYWCDGGRIWSVTSSRVQTVGPDTGAAEDSTVAWYATRFTGNEVKVNRVVVNISAGTATGIEILSCNESTDAEAGFTTYAKNPGAVRPDVKVSGVWTVEKKISGNFGTGNVTIDIPDSSANSYWLVKVTGCTDALRFSSIEMYALSDNELGISTTEGEITGNVSAGATVTFNYSGDATVNENAKLFFALYSGTTLKSVTPVACPLTGMTTYTHEYQIPSDAGSNLSVKAFILDGNTLVPLLLTPVSSK